MTDNFPAHFGTVGGSDIGMTTPRAGSSDLLAEYRLQSVYLRPFLTRFIACGILAGAFALGLTHGGNPISLFFLPVFGLVAVYNGSMSIWRSRFRTRVTTQGIEIRGYFNHFVPWADVKAIQDEGFGYSQPLDAGYGGQVTYSGRVYSGTSTLGMGTTGARAKLGVVRIFRWDGKSMMLRAPLVTAWAPDPEFSDKLSQMQALSAQYGTRPIGS
jgi:hypothetical protein